MQSKERRRGGVGVIGRKVGGKMRGIRGEGGGGEEGDEEEEKGRRGREERRRMGGWRG